MSGSDSPDSWDPSQLDDASALRLAAQGGHEQQVHDLLSEAADPAALAAATDEFGMNALHQAACCLGVLPCGTSDDFEDGFIAVIRLLLQTDPQLAVAQNERGETPLHIAAGLGWTEQARLLLAAAPSAAAIVDERGMTALDRFVSSNFVEWQPDSTGDIDRCYRMARLLLAAPSQCPGALLRSLNRAGTIVLPLYADVARHHALTAAEWQLMPSPCPGLAPTLPTVLERSTTEAAQLVAHLYQLEHQRLHTAALALHRAQAVTGLVLPQPLVWRILAACLA